MIKDSSDLLWIKQLRSFSDWSDGVFFTPCPGWMKNVYTVMKYALKYA